MPALPTGAEKDHSGDAVGERAVRERAAGSHGTEPTSPVAAMDFLTGESRGVTAPGGSTMTTNAVSLGPA